MLSKTHIHLLENTQAEDADVASFHVRPGDVIVMGSDGLLDNVSDTDIANEMYVLPQVSHLEVHEGGAQCCGHARHAALHLLSAGTRCKGAPATT